MGAFRLLLVDVLLIRTSEHEHVVRSLPELLEEVREEDGEGGRGEGQVAEEPRDGRRRRVDSERRRGRVLHRALDRRRV